MHFNKL